MVITSTNLILKMDVKRYMLVSVTYISWSCINMKYLNTVQQIFISLGTGGQFHMALPSHCDLHFMAQ